MAITKELLTKNVEGLTDEQITAIETLSNNAFSEAIAKRVGEIHGQYDQDIKGITGEDKPAGTKTYEWLKNVLTSYKTKASSGGEELEKLKAAKAALEKQVKEGAGSEVLKQQITDLESKVSEWENKYQTEFETWKKKYESAEASKTHLQIETEFSKGLAGVKFKPKEVIPDAVKQPFIENAKRTILAKATPDWIDDGRGGKRMVFRNADGQIMNNPENALNPYTASELLLKELAPILDEGQKKTGAGSKGGKNGIVAIGGATTQAEAMEMIVEHLLAEGISKGSKEFHAKTDKIWKDNNIMNLPIK